MCAKPYVINLDKSTSRWKKLQTDWKGVFNLTRVSAVEKTPGWMGCALSHIKIIEQAKARKDPWVLVWEDDCIPRLRNGEHTSPIVIKQLWNTTLEKLSQHMEQWDIVLGATSQVIGKATYDSALSTKLVKMYKITNGFTTHWTLYNASVYDRMIAWKIKSALPIDVYMYSIARVHVTKPFLAEQTPGFSIIENKHEDYSHLFNNAEKILKEQSVLDKLPIVSIKIPK